VNGSISSQFVKALIVASLEKSMSPLEPPLEGVPDDFDMRAEGVVDSLGFVRLITELEEQLGFDIDLADLDPADLTAVGPLSKHIAAMHAQSMEKTRA
jgi:acyl carrier protein